MGLYSKSRGRQISSTLWSDSITPSSFILIHLESQDDYSNLRSHFQSWWCSEEEEDYLFHVFSWKSEEVSPRSPRTSLRVSFASTGSHAYTSPRTGDRNGTASLFWTDQESIPETSLKHKAVWDGLGYVTKSDFLLGRPKRDGKWILHRQSQNAKLKNLGDNPKSVNTEC